MASLLSHAIQLAEAGRLGVRWTGWPPAQGNLKEICQTSPPVTPWSLIRPPMNAMDLPSGDHRGRAICRLWSGPEISDGLRIAVGFGFVISQVPDSGPGAPSC